MRAPKRSCHVVKTLIKKKIMKETTLTSLLLRMPLALSLAGHGLVRLPKLGEFVDWMATTMQKSPLPEEIVRPFAYVLPFAETVLGLSLLLGMKTSHMLYGALLLMSILIAGSCSVENWQAIEAQLLHAGYALVLMWRLEGSTDRQS